MKSTENYRNDDDGARRREGGTTMNTEASAERRTKRRYAHELFPHAEGEARPLESEVPYRIARAVGFNVDGTSWFDMDTKEHRARSSERTMQLINESRIALLAMAMHKGLTGDEAWRWAEAGMGDGEMWGVYEAAEAYGVDVYAIKPYPCGPEPECHDHLSAPHRRFGFEARTVTRVEGKESECDECTEPREVVTEPADRERSKTPAVPSPAEVAARYSADRAKSQERERVSRVRSRRRARRGAVLRSHVDEETLGVLAKLAHPSRGAGVQ